MKNTLLALSSVALLALATVAHADTFFLTSTNSSTTVPCSVGTPCAQITLTTSGNDATFTVTSLDNHYIFDTFGFDFTGTGALTLFGTPTGEVSSPTLGGSGHEDGYGLFSYNFDTGENGGSNGPDCVISGGTPGAGCTFSFTVQGTSALTVAELDSAFAGHLAATGGNTGYVGVGTPTPETPEPSSLMLLGTGVLGAAGLLRRKMTSVR
jgi:hypothetical protein